MPNSHYRLIVPLCALLFSLSLSAESSATEPHALYSKSSYRTAMASCLGESGSGTFTTRPVNPESRLFGCIDTHHANPDRQKRDTGSTASSTQGFSPDFNDVTNAKKIDSLPQVPITTNAKVERFVRYFQSDAKWYFKKWLERTGGYDARIKKTLREEGVPDELFYIALIESGLSPTTRSHANAVGMWQFIKPTAKRYGLRVDWWIDERRDPVKSTRAAARFFKKLYTRYGSWYMAMAGYNGGEGRIRRAIKKYGTADYWALSKNSGALRRETRNYVPKYLAAVAIVNAPEEYGFIDLDYKGKVEYDTARISTPTDLRVIARATGVDVWKIKKMNPELLRMYTPPNYPEYEIKLPHGTASRFWENFTRIPPSERVRFVEHRLKPGETVSALAHRYGTPVKPILSLNNLKNPRRIRAGTVIMVPVRSSSINKKGKGRT